MIELKELGNVSQQRTSIFYEWTKFNTDLKTRGKTKNKIVFSRCYIYTDTHAHIDEMQLSITNYMI